MTDTLDQLERSVERLNRAVERLSSGMGKYGFANVCNNDVQFLHSQRDELLAIVERMRGALEFYADRKLYEGNDTSRWTAAGDDEGRTARDALTTGEDK